MTEFNFRTLDIGAFADARGALSGSLPLHQLQRLLPSLSTVASDARVNWQLRGGWRAAGMAGLQPSLHLQADAALPLVCQRCLDGVTVPVSVDRHFVFAPDEATAVRWDEDCGDDVLVMQQAFDAAALLEDELIMALPLIAHHSSCPRTLEFSARSDGFEASEEEKSNPFAALAAYKGKLQR